MQAVPGFFAGINHSPAAPVFLLSSGHAAARSVFDASPFRRVLDKGIHPSYNNTCYRMRGEACAEKASHDERRHHRGRLRLIREQGDEALTVRNLAAFLGCSTQWIMYQFPDTETLKELTYQRADSRASMLLANGVLMKQIQDWMGHSDFSTTANIYAHLDYQSKVTSAEAMLAGLGLRATGIEPLAE